MWTVYLLVDPRDGLPHYVGATSNIKARLSAHKRAKGENKRHKWLKELKELGLSFEFVPIGEYWYKQHAYHCEAIAINNGFAKGWPLTNYQNRTKSTEGASWDRCGKQDTSKSVSLSFFRMDINAIGELTVPITAYGYRRRSPLPNLTHSAKCGWSKVEPDRQSLRLWKYYEKYIIRLGWHPSEKIPSIGIVIYRYMLEWWNSRAIRNQQKEIEKYELQQRA